jgi:hypothetical protein
MVLMLQLLAYAGVRLAAKTSTDVIKVASVKRRNRLSLNIE